MKNTLEMIQSNPHAITEELLAAQAEQLTAAQETASAAFAAYHDDLNTRRQALEQQTNEYSAQIEILRKKGAELSAQINDFSSRGEIDAAAEADAQFEAIEREISTLERKKRLAGATKLKGDGRLYQAAKEALDILTHEHEVYYECMAQIRAVALDEKDRLLKIATSTENLMQYQTQTLEQKNKAFEKIDRHFRDLDRIEKEAREHYVEEYKRKEAEAAAKRNIRVIIPMD